MKIFDWSGVIGGAVVVAVAISVLVRGIAPSTSGPIQRREEPMKFWLSFGMMAAAGIACLVMGLWRTF